MLEILAQYNQLPIEPALPTNIGEIVQKISNGFYSKLIDRLKLAHGCQ
jgi:hypothetical protein